MPELPAPNAGSLGQIRESKVSQLAAPLASSLIAMHWRGRYLRVFEIYSQYGVPILVDTSDVVLPQAAGKLCTRIQSQSLKVFSPELLLTN